MTLEYVLAPRTNGANPFAIFTALGEFDESELARAIKVMPYRQFLQTAYWFAVSSKAKSDAGMRCQVCNGQHKLNVHHRTYSTHGREHLHMNDLVVLDEACHGLFHGHREPIERIEPQERAPRNTIPRHLRREEKAKRALERVMVKAQAAAICEKVREQLPAVYPDTETFPLTRELINQCRTNGSFTSATLNELPVERPLVSGWVNRLIGTEVSRETYRRALAGRFEYA